MDKTKAISILKNPDSYGLLLMKAIGVLTNGTCFAWEFDTVFEHLKKEFSITMSTDSADRLMACLAVKANPSFLWDVNVFQGVVQTLNGTEAIVDTIVQCSVGECAWAVTQLRLLGEEYSLDYSADMYNDDPSIYMAACAAADGFSCMPEELSFCDDEFERMFPLSKKPDPASVRKIRLLAKKASPVKDEDSGSLLSTQVRKLQEVSLYVETHKKEMLKHL